MSQKTANTNKYIKLFFILIGSHLSLLSVADENYFTPKVKGNVVHFGTAPFFIRDTDFRLVMSGPNDYLSEKTYSAGDEVFWLSSQRGTQALSDGVYNFEITFIHNYGPRQGTPLDLEGRTSNSKRESGTLSIISGDWVSPEIDEDDGGRDQVIADDLIVDGSICAGIDCVNNESFGADTLRLKENNLRIRFMDTSNSASFPGNDWELRANDTTNGGANKFSIVDADQDNEIFTVEADAPENSLFVDDRGRVGFGTNAPVLDQHLLSGNTPATRYEQDGSGGFPSQSWDVGGNETEFFIRDASNAQVPLRIQPGAPSDSLVVNSAGDIEIGGSIVNNRLSSLPKSILSAKGQSQLASLDQVEQHINRFQQLPGIDDQSKDLVLLQLQLLEKVQELTLYTIEQDKRIAELEAKLEAQ